MTYAASAVALWVGKYNQSQTDLANQTAATIAEHNARYVNNAGYGQLWSENAAYWQSQYNTLLGQYNALVTDRDTWHTRANQAWGDSQVWSSGTPYSAQRPPALKQWTAGFAASSGNAANISVFSQSNPDGAYFTNITLGVRVVRAGYYACWLEGSVRSGNYANGTTINMNISGVGARSFRVAIGGNSQAISQPMIFFSGGSNDITLSYAPQDGNSGGDGTMYVIFVPYNSTPN